MQIIKLSPYIRQSIKSIKKAIELGYDKYLDLDEMVYALVKRDIEDIDKPVKVCFRRRCYEVWTNEDLRKAIMFLLWSYKVRI
jgi:hypothetical protein